ncbi:PREDICTED: uncharacterized protein LOC108375386 [Rhagoletis zephyria]|uniref:uncharacterized protein LOC108375386 n=1 Tax=Rhagoletis zephyria TaxID=28612 RepID=UPI00081141EA|nr:PREDICTED: uncharacterized protein LOC108375386 [Rhagoletis zephyria]XP_017486995.1 PREDICTED: uncharacterized protein LOC108375386 [Rhagoletis zephyria]XP_017486996.1 PREDICTED: uncharacterized protein LOC108375386 [Rhagoletis zephyria]
MTIARNKQASSQRAQIDFSHATAPHNSAIDTPVAGVPKSCDDSILIDPRQSVAYGMRDGNFLVLDSQYTTRVKRYNYIKKLIEDRAVGEEGVELLLYCNWENPHFARAPLVWNSSLCRKAGFSIMRHSQHTLTGAEPLKKFWINKRARNSSDTSTSIFLLRVIKKFLVL